MCDIRLGELEHFDSAMIAHVPSCSCLSMFVGPAPCNITRTEGQLKTPGSLPVHIPSLFFSLSVLQYLLGLRGSIRRSDTFQSALSWICGIFREAHFKAAKHNLQF